MFVLIYTNGSQTQKHFSRLKSIISNWMANHMRFYTIFFVSSDIFLNNKFFLISLCIYDQKKFMIFELTVLGQTKKILRTTKTMVETKIFKQLITILCFTLIGSNVSKTFEVFSNDLVRGTVILDSFDSKESSQYISSHYDTQVCGVEKIILSILMKLITNKA